MIACNFCQGTGMIFNAKGASQCSRCAGKGAYAPAVEAKKKIVILGEAWGEEEERLGLPFVGASGNELNRMLEEAGISRADCHLTNVFNLRPKPTNDIKNLGTAKQLSHVPMPEMSKGIYLQDQFYPELKRLYQELEDIKPNLVIALGNTAIWALTGNYGIRTIRGTVMESSIGVPGLKVLPTYHPAAVLRDWSMRPVVVADLMKAARQSKFPEVRRPARELWIEPTLRDIEFFYQTHVIGKSKKLSIDIETGLGYKSITCVGFAPSEKLALVIPFYDPRKPGGSYWPTAHQEKLAWQWVAKLMQHVEDPEIEILGQNFLFDINWLWTKASATPKNFVRDTMLKAHAMNPELEKGLGFLGSVHTDEPAWKLMRGKTNSTKRGE